MSIANRIIYSTTKAIQNSRKISYDHLTSSIPPEKFRFMARFCSIPQSNTTVPPISKTLTRTYQVVVAATRDMGIGKNGELPWRLPSDLKFFKDLTMNTSDPEKKNAVVMGRKTWESIPHEYRPLPGRLNVVLSRSGVVSCDDVENVVSCESIPLALELLGEHPYCLCIEKVFVIGGGQVLREALNGPGCDAIHITQIDASIECDTYIPQIDLSLFKLWRSSPRIVENNVRFSFITYVRTSKSSEWKCHAVSTEKAYVFPNFLS